MPTWVIPFIVFLSTAFLYVTCLIFGFTTGHQYLAVIGVASFIALIATGFVEWARQ